MSQDKEKTAFRRSFFAPILCFFDVFQCLFASRYEMCRTHKCRPLRGIFIPYAQSANKPAAYLDYERDNEEDGRLIPTLPFYISSLIVSFSSAREPAHEVHVVLVSSL